MKGHLDRCDAMGVTGWAWCESHPAEHPVIECRVDGKLLLRARADRFRSDLVAAGIGDGNYGFEFLLPPALFDDHFHQLEFDAVIKEYRVALIGSPLIRPFFTKELVSGHAQLTEDGLIHGWVHHRGQENLSQQVELRSDNGMSLFIAASIFRPDLKRLGLGNGNCGFQVVLPWEWYRSTKTIDVVAVVGNHRVPLEGSPLQVDLANSYYFKIHQNIQLERSQRTRMRKIIARLRDAPPLISIIMPVFDPPEEYLVEAIESVLKQSYRHWQLCIADDASRNPEIKSILRRYAISDKRIQVVFRHRNGNISSASNSALRLVKGDYFALLDHDDLLHRDALLHVATAITKNPEIRLLFSDEDKCDALGQRYDPYFKFGWDRELLLGQNCVSHLGVFHTGLVRQLGGFRRGYEGSQDYDLTLRVSRLLSDNQVLHIPKVLYHWRAIPGSAALANSEKSYAADAMCKSLKDHLRVIGLKADTAQVANGVFFRIVPKLPRKKPLVSVLWNLSPQTHLSTVSKFIKNIRPGLCEFIFALPLGYSLPYRFLGKHQKSEIRIVNYPVPTTNLEIYSSLLAVAAGNVFVWISGQITPRSNGHQWFDAMLGHALRSDIGLVFPKLIDSNQKVISVGWHRKRSNSSLLPMFSGIPAEAPGMGGCALLTRKIIGNDDVLFFVRRENSIRILRKESRLNKHKGAWVQQLCKLLTKEERYSIVYPGAVICVESHIDSL